MRRNTAVETLSLASGLDGAILPAFAAHPARTPVGGVVVIQEIFGLTDHIAEMCQSFADAGYEALAPSLFERSEAGFRAELDPAGIQKGLAAVREAPWPQVMADVQAAIDALPQPAYITGFCYGGAVAWLAGAKCSRLSAASCFYGRLIADLTDEKPRIPVMLHYGANDAGIPVDNVERVRAAAPDSPLYLYDAGHGFCRRGSHDFNAAACELALARTLDWFARWR